MENGSGDDMAMLAIWEANEAYIGREGVCVQLKVHVAGHQRQL